MKPYLSHSAPTAAAGGEALLEDHLRAVANLAEGFAAPFASAPWGYAAGMLHDLGKYSDAFQNYLSNPQGRRGEVNHSSAGGIFAKEHFGAQGAPLAFAVFGHHAGLPNKSGGRSSADERLQGGYWKAIDNERIPQCVRSLPPLECPPFVNQENADKTPMLAAFWIRMLFSCLVDADRLCAEAATAPQKSKTRGQYPPLAALKKQFDIYMARFAGSEQTPVNKARANVLEVCRKAGREGDGNVFRLTVPTGGGKTLSSMAFALEHAVARGKKRVIYAIPYTSIVEQTAEVFGNIFGKQNIAEHHSNIRAEDAEQDEAKNYKQKLAAENWDAPVVLTTNVQFFESLFAAAAGKCRKLHNICESVVILDEAQTLPVEFLQPILGAVQNLAEHYKTAFVFCTATQPAFDSPPLVKRGIAPPAPGAREICPPNMKLFGKLRRVKSDFAKTTAPAQWAEVAAALCQNERALCIVNTRDDCARLYGEVVAEARKNGKEESDCIHLSALMCGEHRSQKIGEIRGRLRAGRACIVVATNLIEAGVDVDFPVVWRAMAGLDSIAQAAGRCNREGKLPAGELVVFRPPNAPPPGLMQKGANATRHILALDDSAADLPPEIFPEYFRLFYASANSFDKEGIVEKLKDKPQFRTAAEKFRLIEEDGRRAVVVPFPDDSLRKKLRGGDFLRERELQRFVVSVAQQDFADMENNGEIDGDIMERTEIAVLSEKGEYSPNLGLVVPRRRNLL